MKHYLTALMGWPASWFSFRERCLNGCAAFRVKFGLGRNEEFSFYRRKDLTTGLIIFTLGSREFHLLMVYLGQSIAKWAPDARVIFFAVDQVDPVIRKRLDKIGEVRPMRFSQRKIRKKLFCATRRAYLFPELRREFPNASLMWIDADSTFRRPASELIKLAQSVDLSMRAKDLKACEFASGVIIGSPRSSKFFKTYRRLVSGEIHKGHWMTDQWCLNRAYRHHMQASSAMKFVPLPSQFCDVQFRDDGVLWTAKGTKGRQRMLALSKPHT